MSQFNYAAAIDPLISGGSDLNTALDAYELAVNSSHSGASRPAYLPANGTWVKTVSGTQHELTYYDGTDDIIIATINPTDNSVLFPINGVLNTRSFMHIQDQKTTGLDGGSLVSGSFQQRVLNTIITNSIAGASLSSNRVTLPGGEYYIEAFAPALAVNAHKTRLFNVTDAVDIAIGTSQFSNSSNIVQTISSVSALFTLLSTKQINLGHQCSTTKVTNGLGSSAGFGAIEVYADIKIWKVG